LKAKVPIAIEPSIDESKQFLCLDRAELGINVFAATREGLLAELHDQLRMLWAEYALANDDTLDSVARQLKLSLRAAFSEASNAA